MKDFLESCERQKVSSIRNYAWLILLVAGLYWGVVFGISVLSGRPLQEWLVHLGVPALNHLFSDMKLVGVWCDWSSFGRNPFLDPPEDLAGRVLRMNYPPIFLATRWIGLSSSNFYFYGIIFSTIFYVMVASLAQPRSVNSAMIWIAIVCSPAVVFAVERANFDLLVFSFLVLSVIAMSKPWISALCILIPSLLKFFPIVGLASIIGSGRRGWVVFSLGLAVFAIYLLGIRAWLPFIFGSLDGNVSCAFGASVLPAKFGKPDFQLIAQGIFAVLGVIAGVAGIICGGKVSGVSEKAAFAARLGLPIFLLLFLSGAQFDYKTIFLILSVPAIIELINHVNSTLRNWGVIWMVCFLAYLYWMFFSGESCLRNFLLKQGLASLLFVLSAFLCGVFYQKVISISKRNCQ
jgi:hypothetical protein